MIEKLAAQKVHFEKYLHNYFTLLKNDSISDSPWKEDGYKRLEDYASRGKMIRGALVCLGIDLFVPSSFSKPGLMQQAYHLGSVIELFQTMLLIHDDVMDQDDLRRGKPSVHAQYRKIAAERACANPNRLGESLGICLGDVAVFNAYELLSALDCSDSVLRRLLRLYSRELSYVGFAQMDDVFNSGAKEDPELSSILQVYRFKTGRYTFSLPLVSGALLAGKAEDDLKPLVRVGELLGIIFQIRDDHINLFGDPALTGKPAGSDIRENKRTLHRNYLFQMTDISQVQKLGKVFGNAEAQEAELVFVLDEMQRIGVPARIENELERYKEEIVRQLDEIKDLLPEGRDLLEALLRYNLERVL